MSHLQAVKDTLPVQATGFTQLTTFFDDHNQIAWGYMHAEPRPCFTHTLLSEYVAWFSQLVRQIDDPGASDIRYMVIASSAPGIYNLGGDLNLFSQLIAARKRDQLLSYARACIDPLYYNATHLNRPGLKSITLVQGDALGGGFECALSGNVLIAERGCKMGFPEILFNLFPGMGAITLLGRRIGHQKAEKIILSGKLYLAEELHELGVVDVLAEPGEGEQAVYEYIRREARSRNGALALRAAREISQPVSYDELMQVADIWVDAAMRLEPKDLRMMERLVSRQNGKAEASAPFNSAPLAG
ncbi:MAG TPA: crotonase/enoyl-CoA hydratase family protein [Thiobacillaceae bacterium]|nr:crotonase/enoyl-CoA hydratase family protein [Thiobacillaceae bacterium]